MGFSQFTIGVALLIVGSAITLYFFRAILGPLGLAYFGTRGTLKLRRCTERLAEVDTFIAENNHQEAIVRLRKAIVLADLPTREQVDAIRLHHQNVLSRSLIIAEELHASSEGIAELERLFLQRADLQKLLLKASETYQRFLSKRKTSGKPVPDWSKEDYKNKIAQIREELKANKNAINSLLETVFTSIQTPAKKEDIVYH